MQHAIFAVSAVIISTAVLYLVEALHYSRGTAAQPGPGLFPLLVGTMMLVGAIATILEAKLAPPESELDWPDRPACWRMLVIVAATLCYIVLLVPLGQPIAGTLTGLLVMQVMGLANWPLKIGLALAMGLGSYLVFTTLLGYPLPAGSWLGL